MMILNDIYNNNDESLITQNNIKDSNFKKANNIFDKSFVSEIKCNNSYIKNSEKSSRNLTVKKKTKKRLIKFNKLEKETNNNNCSITISNKEDDLNDMDYEDIIKYDKRTYLRMYWACLVYSQINSGTFCTENNLHLFVIKLSFFIFTFEINLFFNAFFYTDEYISDAYHNNGILDFVSGLPKSIYSTVVSYIISELLQKLSNSVNELYQVIKEKTKFKNFEGIINIKLKKLMNKLIAYYVIIFLLEIIFLYFVSAFCAVFRYSQNYLFIGFFESFSFDFIISVFVCLLISLLRYKSIQNQNQCYHRLSNIIKFIF